MSAVAPDLLWQMFVGVVLAGAVYGGIRSDLKALHEHIRRVEKDADKAHERIDSLGYGRRRHSDAE
jgi:hypothetical protein